MPAKQDTGNDKTENMLCSTALLVLMRNDKAESSLS